MDEATKKALESAVSPENVPASSWFKFKNVGDQIVGVFQEYEDVPAANGYQPQRVYTVVCANGDEMKVGVPLSKKFIIQSLKKAVKGDVIGLRFDVELPPKQKGHSPTKGLKPYYVATPEGNANRKFKEEHGEDSF